MEIIEHTYTIQWVGPMNYDEYKSYIKANDTIDSLYFNLYYFEARKDARCKWSNYFGIHKKNNGINKRVNTAHEHLGIFIKEQAKHMKIWIGSFANPKDQKKNNIDLVETLFIKAYNKRLTLNKQKKMSIPTESICVINTYYSREELIKMDKYQKPSIFDDVLIYLNETNSFMHGNLSKMRGTI